MIGYRGKIRGIYIKYKKYTDQSRIKKLCCDFSLPFGFQFLSDFLGFHLGLGQYRIQVLRLGHALLCEFQRIIPNPGFLNGFLENPSLDGIDGAGINLELFYFFLCHASNINFLTGYLSLFQTFRADSHFHGFGSGEGAATAATTAFMDDAISVWDGGAEPDALYCPIDDLEGF
jgi:hypothetical protein